MENCTAKYLSDNDYGGKYSCGPDGKQTEVRVIERDNREQVLWAYVVRPQSIMCKSCFATPRLEFWGITFWISLQKWRGLEIQILPFFANIKAYKWE